MKIVRFLFILLTLVAHSFLFCHSRADGNLLDGCSQIPASARMTKK